jgi:predicted nucleic acid-binding protein
MNTPKSWLLDSCFVIYLGAKTSQFHAIAHAWLDAHDGDTFYLCSLSEGALLRVLPRKATAAALEKAWVTL